MRKLFASVAAGAALMASSAFATPVYTGDTFADFDTNPPLPTDSGYYIWSNEDRTSWSVRWTGNNNNNTQSGSWYGSIELGGLELTSVTEVQFESVDSTFVLDLDVPGISDVITHQAYAGPVWDGFDFTLESAIAGEVIGFNLGSSLFSLGGNGEKDSVGIFIGSAYSGTQVLVQGAGDSSRVTQNFEISVPEPGSLALFSLGIIGLSLARRKVS
ncbi:MAG: PEP-CTERM sorting domain-containing protein [Ketobacteraceae bacterium]|nr:PEP-CTERM sorting domain-containing protein [Ketobacteraceae bacterium]